MKNLLWGFGMAVSLAAFGAVMIFANYSAPRSAADLEVADHCVDWAHLPIERQRADLDLTTRCNRYFNVRSERDSDEDDERWGRREAARHAGAAASNP